MTYKHIHFDTSNEDLKAILIACLSEESYEGFEETDNGLNAFIPSADYRQDFVDELSAQYSIPYTISDIEQQNWNAQWERSFEPVVVGDFCTIRADFHEPTVNTRFEIVITPKMSFGTGHHATTQLMIGKMKDIDMEQKQVLDFGTGTGVLAILAEKLHATAVLAIDNDEWSVENTKENIGRNNAERIEILQGSLEIAENRSFDVILANINRHILLQYMQQMYVLLNKGGKIIMSGLLTSDREIILEAAEKQGFILESEGENNNWIVLIFKKSDR
jgi:ribosomal protein L11 methyltransferase